MLVAVAQVGVARALLQALAATTKAYKVVFDCNSTAQNLLLEEACTETHT